MKAQVFQLHTIFFFLGICLFQVLLILKNCSLSEMQSYLKVLYFYLGHLETELVVLQAAFVSTGWSVPVSC